MPHHINVTRLGYQVWFGCADHQWEIAVEPQEEDLALDMLFRHLSEKDSTNGST